MNDTDKSAHANALRAGVTEEMVADAITRSGYPLQTIVANELRDAFVVQEEWCYQDRDSGDLRALDLRAHVGLHDYDAENQPRVRPRLDLLVECKQSDLPYVFFLSPERHHHTDFPFIAGTAHDTIQVCTDDDRSTWTFSHIQALGLESDPFLAKGPPNCTTFSKCVRKGGDLELSGTEPYQGLVLPLVKALLHLKKAEAPPATAVYFDVHIGLGVAVLDAPMVGVDVAASGHTESMLPWVRVSRHEYVDGSHRYDRSRFLAIDIVHRSFLREYVESNAVPFAERFAALALKHHVEIAEGCGFVKGMGAESWFGIEGRLQPPRPKDKRRDD